MKPELYLLVPLLLVGVILQFTPLLTRSGIFFSANVDPDFPQQRGWPSRSAFVSLAERALDGALAWSALLFFA